MCAGLHSAPSSLLCSKFTPSCPYSQCQFLPCSFVNVCSAGLIKAQQGLALLPAHAGIWSLKGILLSCFFTAQGFFSKRERQLLSPSLLWILAEILLLASSWVQRSLRWMVHALVCWKWYKNRLLSVLCVTYFFQCFLHSQWAIIL